MESQKQLKEEIEKAEAKSWKKSWNKINSMAKINPISSGKRGNAQKDAAASTTTQSQKKLKT